MKKMIILLVSIAILSLSSLTNAWTIFNSSIQCDNTSCTFAGTSERWQGTNGWIDFNDTASGAGLYSYPYLVNLAAYSSTTYPLISYGYESMTPGASANSGEIRLGSHATDFFRIVYEGATNGVAYLDNAGSGSTGYTDIRTPVNGTLTTGIRILNGGNFVPLSTTVQTIENTNTIVPVCGGTTVITSTGAVNAGSINTTTGAFTDTITACGATYRGCKTDIYNASASTVTLISYPGFNNNREKAIAQTACDTTCAGNDTFTLTGHTFVNGDVITSTTTAYGGITKYVNYVVCEVAGDNFALSDHADGGGEDCTTGEGDQIPLTADSTGLGAWYLGSANNVALTADSAMPVNCFYDGVTNIWKQTGAVHAN